MRASMSGLTLLPSSSLLPTKPLRGRSSGAASAGICLPGLTEVWDTAAYLQVTVYLYLT
jgi:hypothetical protein